MPGDTLRRSYPPIAAIDETLPETSIFFQAVRDSAITLDDVTRVLACFACFERMPDRGGVNPITNENMVYSGEGKAIYIENGSSKGNFSLEDGCLLFTGVPEPIGLEVAALIGAKLKPWDNS
ncbi:MAG: hypothetical protein K0U72_03100 [Gammaproteobacteria bacterium]|nr:hypothetical protein [Gammaproteobacteria bacterium]